MAGAENIKQAIAQVEVDAAKAMVVVVYEKDTRQAM